jgi:CubicO group peptidase (beta-lactamase class C family)
MTGPVRTLPGRPSLRHLKLEARRRLKAGEFPALYEAQLAIAREHGQPSWTALKELVCRQPRPESDVLPHLRWIIARFAGADAPGWTPPDDHELRQHFTDEFLTRVPPGELIEVIAGMAEDLREEYVVIESRPLAVQIEIASLQVNAVAEAEPPHRLIGVTRIPLGKRITDSRLAAPTTRSYGEVPAAAAEAVDQACAELGLPGLVLAGGGPDTPLWAIARGWANLDRAEIMTAGHRFPVYFVTEAVTAVAVLRLVAQGRAGLDEPANGYLRTVRLADPSVTVRDLLSHTGGVDNHAEPMADRVPDPVAHLGPVLTCTGERGTFRVSMGGVAALGQLTADITGSPYPAAVASLVFGPLGMASSAFPASWPGPGADRAAVTGYAVQPDADGVLQLAPPKVMTIPATGGLWATAADLVRFGIGWKTLLPDALAAEALRPQTAAGPVSGGRFGLGWPVSEHGDTAGLAGSGPGASVSLLTRDPARRGSAGLVSVALTNRPVPIGPLNARVLQAREEKT